ncbi:hypothetical protein O3P69_011467 [Scylla paramamosain]|uniref:Uncharacterized protein n=1 Tax=Scylla paramamosain TaxID=85552 RepID=A0AAW0T7M1_SCYPA
MEEEEQKEEKKEEDMNGEGCVCVSCSQESHGSRQRILHRRGVTEEAQTVTHQHRCHGDALQITRLMDERTNIPEKK